MSSGTDTENGPLLSPSLEEKTPSQEPKLSETPIKSYEERYKKYYNKVITL